MVTFHVIKIHSSKDTFSFLLGRPWLRMSNAIVDWEESNHLLPMVWRIIESQFASAHGVVGLGKRLFHLRKMEMMPKKIIKRKIH